MSRAAIDRAARVSWMVRRACRYCVRLATPWCRGGRTSRTVAWILTRRSRLIAVAGQVREQVVLDLVAEVSGHEGHDVLPASEVGAAEHLSQVPLRPASRLLVLASTVNFSAPSGKWPQKMTAYAQQIADEVGRGVRRQRRSSTPARSSSREQDVVLAHLAARPCGPTVEVRRGLS